MLDDGSPASYYADTRKRLAELLRSLDDDQLAQVVPATPAWTVLDVARHLAGVCDDVLAGRLEGAATDPWTAKQVEARRDATLDDVLAEWDDKGPQLERFFEAAGPAAFRLVIDVVTHEQDVRGALGLFGGRDTAAAEWSLQQLVGNVDRVIRRQGAPPLRIRAGTDEWLLGGDGEAAATLTAEPYELLRALIGRRSEVQMRAYDWTGDPEPYLRLLPVFPPPASDLRE
ncbi:MAG TPA: maleylpyruvate isomerase family mycothiol-dependent enzyme [Acidimicrobiales bacterium]|jgi:uncharacterized protein (TIGR03083 family)|nr:maleylpyruvate isomerase family mycothiol-dependent enzyme [Acidimicrobiales bacterium]